MSSSPVRMTGLQLRVLILCGLVVLLDGYDIQTMALAVPSISRQWSIPSANFGLVLAAALIGMAVGAAALAPLGDRFGRRPVLIGSVMLVGLASAATATSTELWHLTLWRFLTGVGLGTSMPNATALTSEYMPPRRRAALVTLMFCNVAAGAIVAGFTAPYVITVFGWQGLFIIGGVLPLALGFLLVALIPESVKYLLARSPDDARIADLLKRTTLEADSETTPAVSTTKNSVLILLSRDFRARTLLLWAAFCLNLFAMYLLIGWLPTLLQQAGWPPQYALPGAVLLNVGGITGGLAIAWYVDRRMTTQAMVSAYLITALSLGLFVIIPSDSIIWWVLLFSIGIGTSGTQLALNALAAALYPPVVRATGVGWSYSVGRLGAILGPMFGGLMLQAELGPTQLLGTLLIPVLVCAGCVALLARVSREQFAGPALRTRVDAE